MSARRPPVSDFASPSLFLSREDKAVLDAAEAYVYGADDGRRAKRRHALVRAVRNRWWSMQRTPLAKRRAAIMGVPA